MDFKFAGIDEGRSEESDFDLFNLLTSLILGSWCPCVMKLLDG